MKNKKRNILDFLRQKDSKIVKLKQIMMRDLRRNFAGQRLEVYQIIHRFRQKASEEEINLALDELLYKGKLFAVRHVALRVHTIFVSEKT